MKTVNSSGRCERLKSKSIYQFISAIFIPLLLGVCTIFLTLHQDYMAKQNRAVDLRIAYEERQQNLELNIDGQRNARLVAYIREVSDLLLANNFSLNKHILTSIVFPKTLATIRQLDVVRKGYLVQFLHESKLLSISNSSFLKLSGANLSSIQIGSFDNSIDMRRLSFLGAYLNNASFISISFGYSDFSYTTLYRASFILVSLDYVNFHRARLEYADFDRVTMYQTDFTSANLTGAKLTDQQLSRVGSISGAILPNGTRGRNRNIFHDRNCGKITDGGRIHQNITVSEQRSWMMQMGRYDTLYYLITGWFDVLNDLCVNFTEFDRNGVMLQKRCYNSNNTIPKANENQPCRVYLWSRVSRPVSNYSNQYQYVDEKIESHKEVFMVNIDINLGQGGTCREVYLSTETV